MTIAVAVVCKLWQGLAGEKKQRKGEIIYKDRPGQDKGDLLEINQRSGACSLSLVLIL